MKKNKIVIIIIIIAVVAIVVFGYTYTSSYATYNGNNTSFQYPSNWTVDHESGASVTITDPKNESSIMVLQGGSSYTALDFKEEKQVSGINVEVYQNNQSIVLYVYEKNEKYYSIIILGTESDMAYDMNVADKIVETIK